jgi:hypothetical protein
MTNDLVDLALRVFGTAEGSIITRLFTILIKEKKNQIQKLMPVT